jgi:hypothetical protein
MVHKERPLRVGRYLRLRGYTFFFRYRWPTFLARCQGPGELIRTLRTTDRRTALFRARQLAVLVENLLMQQPHPTKFEVESAVRRWIDERVWATEIRRAETGGYDFLDLAEADKLNEGSQDSNAASELEGLFRFTDRMFADRQRNEIGSALQGRNDGERFEPIVQSALQSIGQPGDRDSVAGRLWARTILRGYATLLDELRETVAAIPRQIAPSNEVTYPEFEFLAHWDDFEKYKIANGEWKTDTAANARGARNVLGRVSPGTTVRQLCTTPLVSDFRTTLLSMPKDHSRGEWATMPMDKLLAETARLSAKDPRNPKRATLAKMVAGTANKHFNNLSEYWRYLVVEKKIASSIPNAFEGFHIPKKKGRAARDERHNWPSELEQKFFESPWIRGCRSYHRRTRPGDEVHRDAMTWVTLWGRLSGVRENEVADALVGDIKLENTTDGPIYYLDIVVGKDSGSPRSVPVPQFLLDAGFLEYRVIGRDPAEPLFPELIPQGPGLRRSAAFTGRFTTLRQGSKCYQERIDFHSFRGNVETTLKNIAGINSAWIDEVIGHESIIRRSEGERYTKAILLPNLKLCLDKITINADLSHLLYKGPRGVPAPGRDREIALYVALAEREMRKKAARKRPATPAD